MTKAKGAIGIYGAPIKPTSFKISDKSKASPLKIIGEELYNLEMNLKKRPVTAPVIRPPSPVVSTKRTAVKPSTAISTRRPRQVWKM